MNGTKHDELVATTNRIAAFAKLELNTPEESQILCEAGMHFILICIDMGTVQEAGKGGWDCRSTFCSGHVVKMLRAMANTLEKRDNKTAK